MQGKGLKNGTWVRGWMEKLLRARGTWQWGWTKNDKPEQKGNMARSGNHQSFGEEEERVYQIYKVQL